MTNLRNPSSLRNFNSFAPSPFVLGALVALGVAGCADDDPTPAPEPSDPITDGPASDLRAADPALAMQSNGLLAAAWSAEEKVWYSFSDDGGSAWSTPRAISGPLGKAARPALAAYGAHFEVAYQTFGDGQLQTVVSRITPDDAPGAALPTTLVDHSIVSQPRMLPADDGLYVAFRAGEQTIRHAYLGAQGVEMGIALSAADVGLCRAEDGTAFAIERGTNLRVSRLLRGASEPIADLPVQDGYAKRGVSCAVVGNQLFVGVAVNDRLPSDTLANAYHVLVLDVAGGAPLGEPIQLFRSDELLLESPKLVALDDGSLALLLYAGPSHHADGELHLVRWRDGNVTAEVVAEPQFRLMASDIAFASRGGDAFVLYEDNGFVGFMSL